LAEFLTTNAIVYYTENIIKNAREELYILFPYLQLSREFYEALKESSDRNVPIIIVYATEDLHTEEKLKLSEIENLEIYNCENLSAKCCCSDSSLLFGSMDFHQMALSDSLEMGILLNKLDDADLYKKIYNEIKLIIGSSKNMNLHKKAVEELVHPAVALKKIYHGVCIKCAMPVSYNLDKPYCRSCTPKNPEEETEVTAGKYCHLCGTIHENYQNSLLCDTCQEEVNR
jgi:hypothetical protein